MTFWFTERAGVNRFQARNLDRGLGSVFGGQIVAPALSSAEQTIEGERISHSVHGDLLRAGDVRKPITYTMERSSDGKSFATRRVEAMQDGRVIVTLSASFQSEEDGLEHQYAKPDAPGPKGYSRKARLLASTLTSGRRQLAANLHSTARLKSGPRCGRHFERRTEKAIAPCLVPCTGRPAGPR